MQIFLDSKLPTCGQLNAAGGGGGKPGTVGRNDILEADILPQPLETDLVERLKQRRAQGDQADPSADPGWSFDARR
jgi:hypothetical protein